MHAILYAAGRATRLGPVFAHQPKILLEVGGMTLLERHVARLAEAGIERLIIVTGHCRDAIAARLPQLSREYRVEITELFNPDFGEGSVISMGVSLPEMTRSTGGVLLMDGDVLYDCRMLPRLLASRERSALLVDFGYAAADDDPVLVPIRNGRPADFRKCWQGSADRVGESIGFFKVATPDMPRLFEETRARSVGRWRLDSMDEVFRALVLDGVFGYEDVTGLPWTEIDYPEDIAYARDDVLPRMVEVATSPTN